LSESHDVEWNLKVNVSEAAEELAELNRLFTTYLALARRMGLPPEMMEMLIRLQQLRIAGQSAIRTLELLKAAYLGAGPAGWALFAGSAALTGFMLADQFQARRPRY